MDRRTRAAILVAFGVVCLLFYYMSATKFSTVRRLSIFSPSTDAGLFWTENAFHYHYAKLAAGAGIPEIDSRMQYPEGMHVFRDETPMMERFAGFCYRHLGGSKVPFHVFLLLLACFYSSAIIFPAFFLSAYLWRNPLAGVVTCLFYIFTYSFIGSVVLGGYVRQDFALPFLFLASFLLLAGIDTGRRGLQAAAAALFAFSFASWHMAQFYFAVLTAGVVVLYFFRAESRSSIAGMLPVVSAVLIIVSLCFESLRSSYFPLSLAMLAGYALLIQHAAFRNAGISTWKRAAAFLLLLAVLTGAAALISGGHYARYSHAYQLIVDKIRFLGVKPEDPSLLGFESRVMWTSSFRSPSPLVFAGWMGMAWLAGIAGAVVLVRRAIRERRIQPSAFLTGWMASAFVVLFALIWRMDVFAAFFVAVLAGAAVPQDVRTNKRLAVLVLLLGMVWLDYYKAKNSTLISNAPPAAQYQPVLKFLREDTRTNDVVLALFQFSPVICAYTERPVVVHSKFENVQVRQKVEEFHAALCASEAAFHGFCRKYGVNYFVYEPSMLYDTTTESVRYMANRLELEADSAVFLMNFAPAQLRHFQLVFQTPLYRIYRVLPEGQQPGPGIFPMLPVYDIRLCDWNALRIRRPIAGH
jgi:hypothetical protein